MHHRINRPFCLSQDDGPPQHDIDALTGMGFPLRGVIKALTKHPGDRNAALEWLFTYDATSDPPNDGEAGGAGGGVAKKGKAWKIPIALRQLFAELDLIDQKSVSTKNLTDSFGWKGRQASVQHDIHELNRILIDALNKSLQTTACRTLCDDLYKGRMVTRIKCTKCGYISERKEDFMDLTMTVKGFSDLVKSLASFTGFEMMAGADQYRCSSCDQKSDAPRVTKLRAVPPVLTFSLARFVYDRTIQNRKKLTDRFEFPLTIDVAPCLDEGFDFEAEAKSFPIEWAKRCEDEKAKAAKVALARAEKVARLRERDKSLPYGGNLAEARAHQDRAAIKVILKAVRERQQKARSMAERNADNTIGESTQAKTAGGAAPAGGGAAKPPTGGLLAAIKAEAERRTSLMENKVDANSKHLYDLSAVLIHIGTAYTGHYHAYIRGPARADSADGKVNGKESKGTGTDRWVWYDFNDSTVKPIPESQIATQYVGANENAYMLLYTRRGVGVGASPVVPRRLREAIEARNAAMVPRRARYTVLSNRLSLRLHPDAMYRVVEGLLAPEPKPAAQAVTVQIDQRKTGVELRALVAKTLGMDIEAISLNMLVRPRFGASGLQCGDAIEDSKETLQGQGLTENNSTILVWDGKTVGGKAFTPDPDIEKFRFKCVYYRPDHEPQTLNMAVPVTCNLRQLTTELHKRVGLPNDLSKLMFHLMYNGKGACAMELNRGNGFLIMDSGVRSDGTVVLGVQLRDGQTSENSITRMFFEESSNRVDLVVADARDMTKRVELSVMKAAPLALLRNKIRSIMQDLPSKFAIRQTLNKKGLHGCLYKDEKMSLANAGLAEPGTVVLVDPGPPLGESEINLLYSIASPDGGRGKLADRVPVRVTQSEALSALKKRILSESKVEMEPEQFAIYRTKGDPLHAGIGAYGRGALIADETTTVAGAGLSNRDSIWIAKSDRRVDGTIQIVAYRYKDYQASSIRSFQVARTALARRVNAGETVDEAELAIESRADDPLPYGGDMKEAMRRQDRAAIRKIMAAGKKKKEAAAAGKKKTTELNALFAVPFLSSMTPFDLKCLLFYHPSGVLKAECDSPHQLRLFQLTYNHCLGAPLSCDFVPLAAQGIATDTNIAVEVLLEPEVRLTRSALRVRLVQCFKALAPEAAILRRRVARTPTAASSGSDSANQNVERGADGEATPKRHKVDSESRPLAIFGPKPPQVVIVDLAQSQPEALAVAAAQYEPYNAWSKIKGLDEAKMAGKTDLEAFDSHLAAVLKAHKTSTIDTQSLPTAKCSLADLRRHCAAAAGLDGQDLILFVWSFAEFRWRTLAAATSEDAKERPSESSILLQSDPKWGIKHGSVVAFFRRGEFGGTAVTPGDFDALVGAFGPRKFVTSRTSRDEKAQSIQKFQRREQQLKIHV